MRLTVLLASLLLPLAVHAQAGFPQQPVRIIVPFGPGGLADITMRQLGERLSPLLGKPVAMSVNISWIWPPIRSVTAGGLLR